MSRTGNLGGVLILMVIAVCALWFFGILAGDALKNIDLPVDNSYVEEPLTAEEEEAWAALTSYEVTELSHAANRHPDAYERIRACQPDWKIMIRPSKFVDVCLLEDGVFGFRVWKQTGGDVTKGTARFEEVTAYIREEIKCIDDLIRFAEQLKVRIIVN